MLLEELLKEKLVVYSKLYLEFLERLEEIYNYLILKKIRKKKKKMKKKVLLILIEIF